MGLTQITTGGVDDNINIDSNTLKVDGTNNRVGIGTAAPTETLTLNTASGASIGFEHNGTEIATINNNSAALYVHAGSGKLLSLGAGGSESMRIDSSGRVGIGTATADGTLHVHSNSAGSVTANSGADDLVVENNGDAGISILTADGNNATAVMFGCPTQTVGAAIRYNHNSSEMALGPDQPGAHLRLNSGDGIEAARLDSSGRLLVGTTTEGAALADNLTVADSGNSGITIRSGAANYGSLYFSDGDSGGAGSRLWLVCDQSVKVRWVF